MPKLQRDSYELCFATKPLRAMSFHDQFRYSPEPEFLGPVLLRLLRRAVVCVLPFPTPRYTLTAPAAFVHISSTLSARPSPATGKLRRCGITFGRSHGATPIHSAIGCHMLSHGSVGMIVPRSLRVRSPSGPSLDGYCPMARIRPPLTAPPYIRWFPPHARRVRCPPPVTDDRPSELGEGDDRHLVPQPLRHHLLPEVVDRVVDH